MYLSKYLLNKNYNFSFSQMFSQIQKCSPSQLFRLLVAQCSCYWNTDRTTTVNYIFKKITCIIIKSLINNLHFFTVVFYFSTLKDGAPQYVKRVLNNIESNIQKLRLIKDYKYPPIYQKYYAAVPMHLKHY